MPRALGSAGSSAGLSCEAVRHILAGRLYSDLACDKLGRRTTESGRKPAVGLKMAENKSCPKCETPMTLNKSGCCTKNWVCTKCGLRKPYKK